ncbi:Repeat domain in Vibrio, Colwellia, Bradyrhizobium and Shewanella family protein [Cryptosporidium meleagridis]|uniref:Repeat domain in Vibrio, Colwellia, Bradyrhizobium and Shewanella family protein n=1 Tax=Cryptosporidium meleagridis TaxID=93969 RepID=A0A2P4Z6N4_9CRYT|nr:Repeat domain in Vibrio, Colwellia, Bradyrhizobium and Shewanella family protein [Cryptosporidium meleagridis]
MILPRRKFNTFWKVLLGNIFLIILCLSNVYSTWNLDWLQSQILFKSNNSGISRLDKFNFPEVPGKIKSFVDFNGDKFTDLVIFNEQEKKIKVLLWNNTEGEFYNGPMANFDGKLASLIAADWTGNGKVDIMVTFYKEQNIKSNKHDKIGLMLFSYNPRSMELENVWVSQDDEFSVVDPLAIDINGDRMLDLLGESDQGKRFIWVNENNIESHFDKKGSDNNNLPDRIFFKKYWWGSEINQWVDLESSNYSYGRLVKGHSSAFVDMDGDCRSDLVLEVYYEDPNAEHNNFGSPVRKGLEIWTNEIIGDTTVFRRYFHQNQKNNKLGLILLPIGALGISYSDFNRDGTTDLIVPVCHLGNFGCESKSRLVFIPNIHEYKDCSSTNPFSFSIYKNNIKENNSEFTIKCRSPNMFCTAYPFKIHSFTDEDIKLIFQELESYDSNRNAVGFFSSLFGGKKTDSHSMGSFFNDFTVSAISDGIIDEIDIQNKTFDNSSIAERLEYSQKNNIANQVAFFFSFFQNNESVKESSMQWAINENNQVEINVGDFNLDGYPDILAILKFGNGTRQTKLIENLPIERTMVNKTNELIAKFNLDGYGVNSSNSNTLSLEEKDKLYEKLSKMFKCAFQWLSGFVTNNEIIQNGDPLYRRFVVSNSISTSTNFSVDYAAFYDFFEDGNLDIISVSFPEKSGKAKVSLNIASSDNPNLFVKVSVLNFPITSKQLSGNSKKVGTTFFGATVKIRMTGLVGDDILMTATQMSHSTGRVLQTPFVLFGLGKTNNYIEELYVGTNYINRKLLSGSDSILEYRKLFSEGVSKWNGESAQSTYANTWTGLIPNTQIIAQLNPIDVPHHWTLVLSVSPQKTIRGVLIVCTLALLIIGIIIIILDRKEKAEDMKEHQGFKSNFISA